MPSAPSAVQRAAHKPPDVVDGNVPAVALQGLHPEGPGRDRVPGHAPGVILVSDGHWNALDVLLEGGVFGLVRAIKVDQG